MSKHSTISKVVSVVALCAVASVGCKKKEAEEEQKPAPAAEAPKAAEPTPEQKLDQDVEALAAVIDMPEDYIQKAEEEINADNLLEEVDKLEKELIEEEKAANPDGVPTTAAPAKGVVAPKAAVQPKVAPAKPAAPKPAAP
jgi:small-conductance mechanosensitive channel